MKNSSRTPATKKALVGIAVGPLSLNSAHLVLIHSKCARAFLLDFGWALQHYFRYFFPVALPTYSSIPASLFFSGPTDNQSSRIQVHCVMTMNPPGNTTIFASRRVPPETDRMIERMRSSDDDEIAASVPSSSSSPKARSSRGKPPRAPTSVRPLANSGSKTKSASRRDRRKPMEEEERGGGVMSSILSKIDASIASVTTCIIPGAQCGDFDLGRIDDLAQRLYTRVAGGGGKKTPQQTATFDDDNTLSSDTHTLGTLGTMDTGADTGYYTGYTGATGLTEGTAASINTSARSQCESTVGRNAHRANANNIDYEDEDLVGDDDDIEDGNSTGMARSSTVQTKLTMNTLNSVSTISTSGTVGGVGSTVGTSKIPTIDSAVFTIAAIGMVDGAGRRSSSRPGRRAGDTGRGMRYESADMGSSSIPSTEDLVTEPTGSNRSSPAVRSERGESTGIELELGKEPRNMPSTAVDIDEFSVDDDDEGLDAIGAAVAKNEIQYNITYVQQNEPLVVEQSLDEPLASRCSGYSTEVEGQEISFDSFKAGLEESLNDGKDERSFADDEGLMLELVEAANELDNKDSKGLVVAKTKSANSNADGRRISSEKKKVKKPPFFAAPPISSNKNVPPPPFFATSTSSRKSKADKKKVEKRSTTVKKETTSVDLDTTAETVDLESSAEI